jgi:hypothetical protein
MTIAIVMLITVLVGCDGDEPSNVGNGSTLNASETVQFEPVPVPEGGWTIEELARTIRLNGVPIELPFTVESLGEKYSFQEEGAGVSWNESDQRLATTLIYDDVHVVGIIIDGLEELNFDLARTSKVETLHTIFGFEEDVVLNDEKARTFLSINGVTRDSTIESVQATLGEPNEIDANNRLIYRDRDTQDIILIVWNGSGVAMIINIIFNDLSN